MTTLNRTTPAGTPDAEAEAFVGQLFGWVTGAGITMMLDVAGRTGLLTAAAAQPGTSQQLADRAGLSERHVRELLNGLTTAGVFSYDPGTATYTLPPSRAMCLTGDGPLNFSTTTAFVAVLAQFGDRVVDTVRHGGGIPYEAYRPQFTQLMDRGMRRVYDAQLLDGYIPAVAGLGDRLDAGARVADLGCGTGHVDNLLGQAYPTSTFTGYDLAPDALEAARAEAARMGLHNVTFEQVDVTAIPIDPPFDVIFAFDSIHDQADPAGVLARAHRALAPGGLFVMIDMNTSSDVEDNVTNPLAPWLYTASLFHCMQVSLAEGGAGLGTCWGRQTAERMLHDAGFADVATIPAPTGDPMNVIFSARRPVS
jgi:SAM-dependent methyltransferase